VLLFKLNTIFWISLIPKNTWQTSDNQVVISNNNADNYQINKTSDAINMINTDRVVLKIKEIL
jgi:hypothetical protein